MAKVVTFNTNRQMNINANQERQLSRKFRCLSKEQKMDVLHLGFGYFRRLAYMDQDQIFEGMLKACDGDYEIFEEEISKLLKGENFFSNFRREGDAWQSLKI